MCWRIPLQATGCVRVFHGYEKDVNTILRQKTDTFFPADISGKTREIRKSRKNSGKPLNLLDSAEIEIGEIKIPERNRKENPGSCRHNSFASELHEKLCMSWGKAFHPSESQIAAL